MSHQVQSYLATGIPPQKLGSGAPSAVPYRVYKAGKGSFMLATASEPQFVRLCSTLGMEQLVDDPRFSTMARRIEHRDALDALLQQRFAEQDASYWLAALASNGLSVGPVNDLQEALQLDVVQERNLFLDPLATGAQRGQPLLRSPLDHQAQGLRRQPPRLGEHSADILAKLGKSGEWPLGEISLENK